MENKQTAPREIWIPNYSFAKHWANPEKFPSESDNCTLIFNENHQSMLSVRCTKYLSETHVFEILDAKDKQIDGQRRVVQSFKDRYYEQIELIDSKNKELEYKDKEIERLKLEIARLRENNASLEFKISAKYKQGYRDGVKDWEDEHLKNN